MASVPPPITSTVVDYRLFLGGPKKNCEQLATHPVLGKDAFTFSHIKKARKESKKACAANGEGAATSSSSATKGDEDKQGGKLGASSTVESQMHRNKSSKRVLSKRKDGQETTRNFSGATTRGAESSTDDDEAQIFPIVNALDPVRGFGTRSGQHANPKEQGGRNTTLAGVKIRSRSISDFFQVKDLHWATEIRGGHRDPLYSVSEAVSAKKLEILQTTLQQFIERKIDAQIVAAKNARSGGAPGDFASSCSSPAEQDSEDGYFDSLLGPAKQVHHQRNKTPTSKKMKINTSSNTRQRPWIPVPGLELEDLPLPERTKSDPKRDAAKLADEVQQCEAELYDLVHALDEVEQSRETSRNDKATRLVLAARSEAMDVEGTGRNVLDQIEDDATLSASPRLDGKSEVIHLDEMWSPAKRRFKEIEQHRLENPFHQERQQMELNRLRDKYYGHWEKEIRRKSVDGSRMEELLIHPETGQRMLRSSGIFQPREPLHSGSRNNDNCPTSSRSPKRITKGGTTANQRSKKPDPRTASAEDLFSATLRGLEFSSAGLELNKNDKRLQSINQSLQNLASPLKRELLNSRSLSPEKKREILRKSLRSHLQENETQLLDSQDVLRMLYGESMEAADFLNTMLKADKELEMVRKKEEQKVVVPQGAHRGRGLQQNHLPQELDVLGAEQDPQDDDEPRRGRPKVKVIRTRQEIEEEDPLSTSVFELFPVVDNREKTRNLNQQTIRSSTTKKQSARGSKPSRLKQRQSRSRSKSKSPRQGGTAAAAHQQRQSSSRGHRHQTTSKGAPLSARMGGAGGGGGAAGAQVGTTGSTTLMGGRSNTSSKRSTGPSNRKLEKQMNNALKLLEETAALLQEH